MDKFEGLNFSELELEEWVKTTGGGKPRHPFPTVTVTWDKFGDKNKRIMGRMTFNTHATRVLNRRNFLRLSFDSRVRLAGLTPGTTDTPNAYIIQYYSYRQDTDPSGASVTATLYLRDNGIPAGRYRLVSGPDGALLFDPDAPLEED